MVTRSVTLTRTIGSLLVAAFAGYEWAQGLFLSAGFFFLLAISLTDVPARMRAFLRAANDYIWRGISTWSPRRKRWLEVGLFVLFCFVFFAMFEFLYDVLDIDRMFEGSNDRAITIGAGVLLLVVFWASALITGLVFALIGVTATVVADGRRRDGGAV